MKKGKLLSVIVGCALAFAMTQQAVNAGEIVIANGNEVVVLGSVPEWSGILPVLSGKVRITDSPIKDVEIAEVDSTSPGPEIVVGDGNEVVVLASEIDPYSDPPVLKVLSGKVRVTNQPIADVDVAEIDSASPGPEIIIADGNEIAVLKSTNELPVYGTLLTNSPIADVEVAEIDSASSGPEIVVANGKEVVVLNSIPNPENNNYFGVLPGRIRLTNNTIVDVEVAEANASSGPEIFVANGNEVAMLGSVSDWSGELPVLGTLPTNSPISDIEVAEVDSTSPGPEIVVANGKEVVVLDSIPNPNNSNYFGVRPGKVRTANNPITDVSVAEIDSTSPGPEIIIADGTEVAVLASTSGLPVLPGKTRLANNTIVDVDAADIPNAPVALCKDITVYLSDPTITPDDVDDGSYDLDGDSITLSIDNSAFNCSNVGGNTVTLTVSDGQLTDTCTATVTVVDDIAPVVTGCDLILIDGPGRSTGNKPSASANFRMVELGSATDNCGGSVAVTGSIDGISVTDGAKVKISVDLSQPTGKTSEGPNGYIHIIGPTGDLTVKATDANGNVGVCQVGP